MDVTPKTLYWMVKTQRGATTRDEHEIHRLRQ